MQLERKYYLATITDHKITRLDHSSVKASAFINLDGRQNEVSFVVKGGPVYEGIEPFVSMALLPAMTLKEPIELDQPISPRLLANFETIQDIFQSWDSKFHKIPVNFTSKNASARSGWQKLVKIAGEVPGKLKTSTGEVLIKLKTKKSERKVACLFSGGVDSFYTFLENQAEIDTLIFVSAGFDISPHPDNLNLRRQITSRLSRMARQAGKDFIEVEVHVQNFSETYVNWALYHGSAMCALAQLLSSQFHTFYFASTQTYSRLTPWGSHPLSDPLWSTEDFEIIHHGSSKSRSQKISRIAASEIVFDNLRVCFNNRDNQDYNCGKCEKCKRTMAYLRGEGTLDKYTVFGQPLDLSLIADSCTELRLTYLFNNWRELLAKVENKGNDPELAQALRQCLSRENNPEEKYQYFKKCLVENSDLLEREIIWSKELEENNKNLAQQLAAANQWVQSLEKQNKNKYKTFRNLC
ncbi:MAG: hypothetical protein JWP00_4709 [Chloroflexi bacterium]|nr:hypothetical protein [Chloroflexota bacterium]